MKIQMRREQVFVKSDIEEAPQLFAFLFLNFVENHKDYEIKLLQNEKYVTLSVITGSYED